ncbi:MAG: hypothetical protein AB1304_02460 [Bacteroidota bacterium]
MKHAKSFIIIILIPFNLFSQTDTIKKTFYKINKDSLRIHDSLFFEEQLKLLQQEFYEWIINDTIDNYNFNSKKRSEFEQKYIDTLLTCLKQNKIPNFLYNSCLDNIKIAYADVHSHLALSLRREIINKLKKRTIKKILKLADKNKLNVLCEKKRSWIPYNQMTTLDLLMEKLKKGSIHFESGSSCDNYIYFKPIKKRKRILRRKKE